MSKKNTNIAGSYPTPEPVALRSRLLAYTAVTAITIYLGWRLFYTLPFSYGYLSIALGVILFVCEFLSGAQAIINYLSQVSPTTLERPEIPDSWYLDIDVFVATHNEDINILYNTINACSYLDYPDKSRVHIHVSDDGNRPEVRELAERLGVNYIPFPDATQAKAGNLNNAISKTSSPFMAFLDADMIPRREFLTHLVPHLYLPVLKKLDDGTWAPRSPEEIDPDYKIGFVQSPQNFYNPDLFQFNLYAEKRIPSEQLYFFREINASRNNSNSSILCGSGFVTTRQAMADAGNFATGTITEDLETGINLQNAGYCTYSTQEGLANGLAPETIPDLIAQRERWGRGCMQTFHNVKPFLDRRIPLKRRIAYLCSVFYWLSFFCRFIFIMSPILVALFNVYLVETSLLELLIFWLPYYTLHAIALTRLSEKTRTVNWSNVFDTVMFPFLFIPVILDMVGIRLKRFRVTSKGKSRQTSTKPSLILPHALMLALSVVGIVFCLVDILRFSMPYNVFILFWLFLNSKNLLMAIFFMLGRVNERFTYRSVASVPAELEVGGQTYTGVTADISEGGCSIALDYPVYIPTNTMIPIRLVDRDFYRAEFVCTMVQVQKTAKSDWTYNMKLEKIEPDQLSQYRQIIYERTPSLPDAINETMPVLEDLKVNFDNRFRKQVQYFSRTLPRVVQYITGTLPDGGSVLLNDFNYRYIKTDRPLGLARGETMQVTIEPGVHFLLTLPEEKLEASSSTLYKVLNWEDWDTQPRYKAVLARWANVKPEAYPRQAGSAKEGPGRPERQVDTINPGQPLSPLAASSGAS